MFTGTTERKSFTSVVRYDVLPFFLMFSLRPNISKRLHHPYLFIFLGGHCLSRVSNVIEAGFSCKSIHWSCKAEKGRAKTWCKRIEKWNSTSILVLCNSQSAFEAAVEYLHPLYKFPLNACCRKVYHTTHVLRSQKPFPCQGKPVGPPVPIFPEASPPQDG